MLRAKALAMTYRGLLLHRLQISITCVNAKEIYMFKFFCWIFVVLSLFFLTEAPYAAAKKKDVISDQEKIEAIKAKKLDPETQLYQIAQIEMDKNVYRVYRIAERIIRANGLDNYPWVIEFPVGDNYVVNAYTEQGNLIVIENGTADTFYDDVSAMAAIIAHEMTHEIQKHMAAGSREALQTKRELDEAKKQYEQDCNSITRDATLLAFLTKFGSYLDTTDNLQEESNHIKELEKQMHDDSLTLSRKHEYEADRIGMHLMAKAGFDPQGYVREFNFFNRTDPAIEDPDQDHPIANNRIWQIKADLKALDINKLKQEGLKNIKNSKPLTYEQKTSYQFKYETKKTLIIHSRRGSNQDANDPFKTLFGK